MIESKSIGCSIATLLASIATAIPAYAQDLVFPREQILEDELGRTAWVGKCDDVPLIGRQDAPGEQPLPKFATNRDGDIAGWRFDNPNDVRRRHIPMLWIRSTPTSEEWTPMRLPAGGASTSAAATGVIRVREREDGTPTGIFVSGWRQVRRGATQPELRLLPMRYEAALWYIPMANGSFGMPEIVPIAPNHCDQLDPGFAAVDEFLIGETAGDAWATEAIEVLYRDESTNSTAGPWLVMHATQAYRCVCGASLSTPIVAHAPMRIEFDIAAWLAARAAGRDRCSCIACDFADFRWTLTDGYPAIREGDQWLLANREARSTVHFDHRLLATTRTGRLDRRIASCVGFPTQCSPNTVDSLKVGPVFGSLIFTNFGTSMPVPEDRYLLGSTEQPDLEPLFPGAKSTPALRIENPFGMSLTGLSTESCPIDMPFESLQYESAANGRGVAFTQITAGWRWYPIVPETGPLTRWARPLAWFPMTLREVAPAICELGTHLPDCEECNPIISIPEAGPSTDTRGKVVELPRLVAADGAKEADAWAIGCEFVGRSSACSTPQFVGGGSKGARIWYQEGNVWKAQQLPKCDSLTEAHSIMPDGAVVVLGQADCGIRGHPFQPIRVVLPPRLGDLNGDGFVGAADMSILLNSFGTNDPCSPADLDGDGVVGAPDLAILLNNWG
jgi:hypothetical protein